MFLGSLTLQDKMVVREAGPLVKQFPFRKVHFSNDPFSQPLDFCEVSNTFGVAGAIRGSVFYPSWVKCLLKF